ncbi:MAG: TonB-dependent receptor [Alphaproteobacteria bacterium]|nr:TonB-dependent receptor [Alphaproteobacteria bacterium]MBU1515858.1 TonB-dependent receptor [Alphaproteobacteria bacterium]MBU2094080.1 TonB-dependent receptor [Alphaproteobacteria bacterium]MBU2151432.1 TonB-dependent receptor [Alphaproteobacteria bacterium]MBU2305292.1 TonB-dependent receptor [Alphaproteobacteria bacterium]
MTISRARLLAAASAFALSAIPAMALAQEAAAIEEIVVTAQKTQQQAIDVPISLTAYGAERLDNLGIQDFADLSLFTPGFEVQDQSPNNPGFVMRGITSDSTDPAAEPRVSVFQDGVSISKAQGSYVELFDLERVEVAKGPQSTLFGRGALIGGVNIIQKKASTEGFDAYFKVEGGNYEYKMGEGAVNAPLGEHAALRLSGRIKARDGYVKNALGGDAFQSVDTSAFRAALRLEPNERIAIDLIANYQKDEPTGTSFKSGGYSPTDPVTGQVLGDRRPQSAAALASPSNFEGGTPLGLDRMVRGYTALASFELTDTLTLNSVSAYRRYDSEETYDPDGTALAILTGLNDATGQQWSQELRLNYDDGGRFRGFVGGNFLKAKDRQRLPLQFDERIGLAAVTGQLSASAAGLGLAPTTPAPAAVFANTAFTGALVRGLVAQLSGNRIVLTPAQAAAIAGNLRSNHVEETNVSSDLDAFDIFADGTFKVTDKLEISAGVRFTRDDKTSGFGSRVVGGRSVLGGTIGAAQIAAAGTPAALAQAQAILGALALPIVQQIPESQLPLFGVTFQPTTGNGQVFKQDLKDDGVTWRLVARYAATDDANLYASFARGRRPEVLAALAPASPGSAARFSPVEAETVDSYEAGAKLALLDRRLRLDGSVYRYDYDNFQTIEQQGTLFVITNAGKAKAYGFEGSADWAVTSYLDLLATYAYSHARFEGGAYDGNRFRLSPDHTLSLAASVKIPVMGGQIAIRPSYTWQSKTFFDDNNDLPAFQQTPRNFVADNVQDEFQKAYGLVNLRVAWTNPDSPFTLEAFATNLADKAFIIDAGNTGDSLGLPTFIAGPPRMFGVGVSYRY